MSILTKSKYMHGLQCYKYLWIEVNEPNKIPPVDEATEYLFEQGNLVGNLAKKLFPKGIELSSDNFLENINKTKESLKLKKPLFEAGFSVNNIYARADILNPVGKKWDIIEVKMSTHVDRENVEDVAFQKYCYELSGLNIRKCFLMHINRDFVKKGKINPRKFFAKEDITSDVDKVSKDIKERTDLMVKTINEKNCPEVKIGSYCNNPEECPLKSLCWKFVPEHSVLELYYDKKKGFELMDLGILKMKDIPSDFELKENNKIQLNCVKTGKIHLDKKGIKEFLNKIRKPVYYLDFETFNAAFPVFDSSKPWENIPFQFSLHVVNEDVKHYSFLSLEDKDPRKELIIALKKYIGKKGSIVAYNASFEISVLKNLALDFPAYRKFIDSLIPRVIDLIVPFKNFHYYHIKQHGSCSLKSVLPVLTKRSYSGMEIAEGGGASMAFIDAALRKKIDKEKTRVNLEKYCCLDTEAMVMIVGELRKMIE